MTHSQAHTTFRGLPTVAGDAVTRIVVDIGNTRVKWGIVGPDGRFSETGAERVENEAALRSAWGRLLEVGPTHLAVSSVNPPATARLEDDLRTRTIDQITWYRSAGDVDVPHRLETPETTGADRALAVLAALDRRGNRGPGIVISCGTAMTVEVIDPNGFWDGGAIAPGLFAMAKALGDRTAQLPVVRFNGDPNLAAEIPDGWGRSTESALRAGISWGTVGALKELVDRALRPYRNLAFESSDSSEQLPWIIWTGGDAEGFSRRGFGGDADVALDLVLEGIALSAFGGRSERDSK